MGRIDIPSNDPHEAYTGNLMGRKEVRTLLKRFSLVSRMSRWRRFLDVGSQHERVDKMARSWRVCRGQRAWHVEREASGTWETLAFPVGTGRAFQPNEESPMGVRESDRLIVL